MTYKSYVAKRILMMIFVLWGVTSLTFALFYLFPRNPGMAMSGSHATPEQIEKFNERWGLNLPVWEQYISYFSHLLRGDLGYSIRTERPVATELMLRFPVTLELAIASILVTLIGIPIGVISATRRGSILDHLTRILSLIGVSLPEFWTGLVLLIAVYYDLGVMALGVGVISPGLVPPTRITGLYTIDALLTGNWTVFIDALSHLILPAFVEGYFCIGIISRLTRSTMLEVLNADYLRAARARGVSEKILAYKHALKNALIPTVTVMGLLFGAILGGAIVVETVFSRPGIGWFAYQSITKADQPAVIGVVLLIAVIYSVVNLAVDLLYGSLDPRIRYG